MDTLRRTLATGLSMVAFVVLAGCSSLSGTLGSSTEPTAPQSVNVMDLEVGACLNEPAELSDIEDVTRVPCAEPHDLEAYHSFDLEGDELPDDETLSKRAEDGCLDGPWDDFVGIAYEQSDMYLVTFFPSADSWPDGDREVLCLLKEPNVKLTGTMRGSAR